MMVRPISDWLAGPPRMVAWRGKQQLGLSEMREQVKALCQRLQRQPGTHWALCFDDSYRFCVALLAALHAGKTPVIPGHCRAAPLEEMRETLDGVLSDMPLTLTMPHLLWDETCAEGDLPAIPPQAALILFTSGSTGTPRKVTKTLRALETEANWLAALWGQQLRGCHIVASVSHQHLYGLTFRLVLPMSLGLPFAARQSFYSEQLTELADDRRYAFISSPAFLRRLDFGLRLPDCALIVSAGGMLAWPYATAVRQGLRCPVSEIYGSTETGIIAWRTWLNARQPWQCFPEVELLAQASDRWRVRSALIDNPDGWLLDDKIRLAADGSFHLEGRHDRVVKIEDKRVSLSEIERRLLALPEIEDAAALAIAPHDRNAIGVVLVVKVALDDSTLTECKRRWKQTLQRWLEPVAMPRYWRVVDAIPITSQSKRDWPQIEELFHVAG